MNQMKKEKLEITISDSDRIECAIRHIQTAVDIDSWAMEIAVEAMQKQIPKKPEQSKIPRYGMGYEYYDWYCPTCGRFLAFESSNGDHHCTCGQKICWEDER